MKKYLNFRPILFCALGLILGLSFVYLKYIGLNLLYVLLTSIIGGILIFIPILLYKKFSLKKNFIITLSLLFFFTLGQVASTITFNNYMNLGVVESTYLVSGRVYDVYDNSNYTRVNIENLTLFNENTSLTPKMNLTAYVYGATSIKVGDYVSFTAYVENTTMFYENKISTYNISNNLRYSCSVNAPSIIIGENKTNLFENAKSFIKNSLRNGTTNNTFSILFAMMVGDTSYMSEYDLEAFRNVGIAHLFAVSGLHISFLGGALFFIFKKLRLNRFVGYFITIFVLIFYAGVCGFSASSIRAVIMLSILYFANIIGNKYDSLSSIALSAIIVLLINPIELFGVGFMLSYASVISISVLSPKIKNKLKFLPFFISNLIAVSVSAQIATFPLLLNYFSGVSIISSIVNLLLVPIISFLFPIIFLAVFIGGAFSIESVAIFLPDKIIYYLSKVVTFFDLKIFILSGIIIGVFIFTYYLYFLVKAKFFNISNKLNSVISMLLAIITIFGVISLNTVHKNLTKLTMIGSNNNQVILISKNKTDVLIVNKIGTSINQIEKFLLSVDDNVLETIIFSSNVSDVPYAVANILTKCKIEKVIYYSQTNLEYGKYFKTVQFNNLVDANIYDAKVCNLNYQYDGRGIKTSFDNLSILALSKVDDDFNYSVVSNRYFDYLVYGDDVSPFSTKFAYNNLISYLKSDYYLSVEGSGNFKYALYNGKLNKYFI